MLFDINRFHFFVLITWQFALFLAAQQIFQVFSNYVPQWKCGDGPVSSDCKIYKSCTKNITFVNVAFDSAAIEYGWICPPEAFSKSIFSQVQFAGVLLGTFSFGAVSDKIGRKPVSIAALSLGSLTTFLSGIAPNSVTLIIIRFFVGLAVGGSLVVVSTYAMEMLLPQQRMAHRAFFNWGFARLLFSLIAMAFPDWRMSAIACAATLLPAIFIIFFILPESPIWLHTKGRLEEMRNSEIHMAKVAGIEYVPVEHEKIVNSKTLWEMLKTKGLLKRLFVLWFMWFVSSISGFTTDLNSNTISGDLYFNQILFSLVIVVSKLCLALVDTYIPSFKRRTLHQGSQFIVCCCFASLTIMTIHKETASYAFLVINLLGTVFIEYTWDACYLCAIESMETSCRASGTGSCSLIARVGAIMAPLLNYANLWWPPSVYLTVVVLGTINLVISYLFLVETKNVNLDNVHINQQEDQEEGEAMIEKKS